MPDHAANKLSNYSIKKHLIDSLTLNPMRLLDARRIPTGWAVLPDSIETRDMILSSQEKWLPALKAAKADKKETWYTYVVDNTLRHLHDITGKPVTLMAAAHDEILAQTGLVPIEYHIRRKDEGSTPCTVLVVSFNQRTSGPWRLFGTSSPARLVQQTRHQRQRARRQRAQDSALAVQGQSPPQTEPSSIQAPSTTVPATPTAPDCPAPPAINFAPTTDRIKTFHAQDSPHPDDCERANLKCAKRKRPATPQNQPIYLRSHAKAKGNRQQPQLPPGHRRHHNRPA